MAVTMKGLTLCLLAGHLLWQTTGTKVPPGTRIKPLTLELNEVLEIKRNANGSIVAYSGRVFHILEWLSRDLGFTYSPVYADVKFLFNSSTKRGIISYFNNKEADLAWGAVLLADDRRQLVDFTYPWTVSSFSLLVPNVYSTTIGAPWKPFHYPIWILLLSSLLFVTVTIYFLGTSRSKRTSLHLNAVDDCFNSIEKVAEYVVLVLFSQGGVCYTKRMSVRLVAAVWCLACFVLVNSYCCTLISFLTSSNQGPLINSIYDLTKKSGVHATVEEGSTLQYTVQKAESGVFKYIRQDLEKNRNLFCRQFADCANRVLSGGYVAISSASLLAQYVNQDLRATGQCRMSIPKESFLMALASFALPKDSPLTRSFDEGMIRLWETGLLPLWRKWYLPNIDKCQGRGKQQNRIRLNLNSLSSTFFVLLVGYGLASMCFVCELAFKMKST